MKIKNLLIASVAALAFCAVAFTSPAQIDNTKAAGLSRSVVMAPAADSAVVVLPSLAMPTNGQAAFATGTAAITNSVVVGKGVLQEFAVQPFGASGSQHTSNWAIQVFDAKNYQDFTNSIAPRRLINDIVIVPAAGVTNVLAADPAIRVRPPAPLKFNRGLLVVVPGLVSNGSYQAVTQPLRD